MKKHLRTTTAALAALGLALVGCEVEDGTTTDDGIESPDIDDGLDDGTLEEEPVEDETLENDA